MKLNLFNLFIEINTKNFVFLVGENNEHNKFSLIYKETIPLSGISNKKIMNFELVYETIQKKFSILSKRLTSILKK